MQGKGDPNAELLDAAPMCRHLVADDSVHAFLVDHRREPFPESSFMDLFPSVANDLDVSRREAGPPERRSLARPTSPARVRDRVDEGHLAALGPRLSEGLGAEPTVGSWASRRSVARCGTTRWAGRPPPVFRGRFFSRDRNWPI